MYVPDTMNRLAEEETIRRTQELVDDSGEPIICDFCDKDAVWGTPVYNPRDAVEGREGCYGTLYMCQECEDNGYLHEGHFECECGKVFIQNHSWDIVGVITDDGWKCQKCFVKDLPGIPLEELMENLRDGLTNWPRINAIPGKEVLWEGEYSGYSDFPGHTSTSALMKSIREAAKESDVSSNDEVWAVVTHGYQFSVALAVYH